jgi:hypothetical protein
MAVNRSLVPQPTPAVQAADTSDTEALEVLVDIAYPRFLDACTVVEVASTDLVFVVSPNGRL